METSPQARWLIKQDWNNAYFLNAKLDKNILNAFLPKRFNS